MKGRVTGISTILRNMRIYSKRLENDLIQEVAARSQTVEQKAKARVPVDTGELKQSIFHIMNYKKGTSEIGASAPYAPYVEFGTGGLVSVPDGYRDFAMQFKGKGIRLINRRPQPFLIPSFLEEKEVFRRNIKAIIQQYSGLKSIRRL